MLTPPWFTAGMMLFRIKSSPVFPHTKRWSSCPILYFIWPENITPNLSTSFGTWCLEVAQGLGVQSNLLDQSSCMFVKDAVSLWFPDCYICIQLFVQMFMVPGFVWKNCFSWRTRRFFQQSWLSLLDFPMLSRAKTGTGSFRYLNHRCASSSLLVQLWRLANQKPLVIPSVSGLFQTV